MHRGIKMDWSRRKVFFFGIALALAALFDAMSPSWTAGLFSQSQMAASEAMPTEQKLMCTAEESISECL